MKAGANQGTSVSRKEWSDGWRVVVAASAGFGMTFGLYVMTAGLFIVPMQNEFGWSRTAVSIGPMIVLVSGPLNLIAGLVVRRLGARPIAIAGLLALTSSIVMLSMVPPDPWMLYPLALIIAVVGTMTSAPVYITGVVSWFSRHAGSALGVTLGAVSVCTAVTLPLLTYVIGEYGWRTGYVGLACVMLLALPLVLLWFRERPTLAINDRVAEPPAGSSVGEVVRDRRLWLLVAAIGSAALVIGGFVSQLMPLLASRGFTPTAAAALGSLFALSIAVGRVAIGVLLDHVKPSAVTSMCFALPAVGMVLLAVLEIGPGVGVVVAMSVAAIGLAQGAEIDFLAFYTLKLFGNKSYSVIFSALIAINSCMLAAGGLIFSGVFDCSGSYDLALYGGTLLFLVAAGLMYTIRIR